MKAEESRSLGWSVASDSPETTQNLARGLAPLLSGGEVILLRGELGTGKTLFASALIGALGYEGAVTSPSYVLMCDYPVVENLTVHHLDFYRLAGDEDLETIGPEEFVGEDSIVLVEWPERCPGAFEDFTLQLDFEVAGEESRQINIGRGELDFEAGGWPEG